MSIEEDDDRKGMSDAYWRAREAADAEREGAPDEPDVISGGDDQVDDSPPPEPPMEIEPYAPAAQAPAAAPAVQTSAAPAGDAKAQRLAVLREAAKLASSPVDTGIGDKDIAEAQGRDREQRGRDAFTEAIQAWLQRRPIRFTAPTEGDDVVKRRQLAEGSALKQRGQQLSVQEQLAKALTDPKAAAMPRGGLSEYQKYEMDRNARIDAEKKTTAEGKAKSAAEQLERDRALLQKDFPDYDLSKADEKTISKLLTLRHAKAGESQAAATLALARKKDDDKQTEGLPNNMELEPGANPAPEQLKDIGNVDRGADEVHRLANRMREVLAKSSKVGRVMPGDDRRQLQQLQGEMTLALKDAGKLGQISAGDQALIDSIRPDAVGLDSLIRDYPSFDAQLKGMERYADDKRSAAMHSIGARHKGKGSPSVAPAPAPTPRPAGIPPDAVEKNGKWYVRYPDGSGWDEIEVPGG